VELLFAPDGWLVPLLVPELLELLAPGAPTELLDEFVATLEELLLVSRLMLRLLLG
jgi:hypothetical protein